MGLALGVTNIGGYLCQDDGHKIGGQLAILKAGADLSVGDVVMVDTAADDQVVKATSGSNSVVGVCVGRFVGRHELSVGPAAGEKALVQYAGIAEVVADGAISRGDRVSVAATAGRVKVATALSATIANGTIPAGAVTVTSTAANGAIVTIPNPTFSGEAADLQQVIGKALSAATGAGQRIRIMLTL